MAQGAPPRPDAASYLHRRSSQWQPSKRPPTAHSRPAVACSRPCVACGRPGLPPGNPVPPPPSCSAGRPLAWSWPLPRLRSQVGAVLGQKRALQHGHRALQGCTRGGCRVQGADMTTGRPPPAFLTAAPAAAAAVPDVTKME